MTERSEISRLSNEEIDIAVVVFSTGLALIALASKTEPTTANPYQIEVFTKSTIAFTSVAVAGLTAAGIRHFTHRS